MFVKGEYYAIGEVDETFLRILLTRFTITRSLPNDFSDDLGGVHGDTALPRLANGSKVTSTPSNICRTPP